MRDHIPTLVRSTLSICLLVAMQLHPSRAVAASCAAPPAGLIAWWRAELSGADHAGTNHAVLQNGTQFGEGVVSNAFTFDGVNDDLKVPADPGYDALSEFTIEFWMKADPSQPVGSRLAGLVTTDYYGIEIGDTYPRMGIHAFASTDAGTTWSTTSDLNGGGPTFPGGEWHHVAGTYDGASLQLYIDGQPWGNSTPLTGRISRMPAGSFLSIGSETGRLRCPDCVAFRFFKGSLDEIGLYTRALTAPEILALYASGAAGKCIEPVAPSFYTHPLDWSAVTGDDVTLSAVAGGTGPLTYQWMVNGEPVPGATSTVLSLTNVQPAQAGVYALAASNSLGVVLSSNATLAVAAAPSCAPAPAGLITWWRAEGDATDSSGTAHGELKGGAVIAPGLSGEAFSFNGSSGYIEAPGSALPAFGTNDFSIEFWVYLRTIKPSLVHLPSAIFVAQDEGGGALNKWLVSMGGDTLSFHLNTPAMGSGGPFLIQAPFKPATNKWYHLAIIRQASLFTAFSNGVPIGSEAFAGPVPAPNAPVTLGQAEALGFFDGQLDEVSIYGRALSTNELQAVYRARSGGKCAVPTAPLIYFQPQDQRAFVGATAIFSVGASGSPPRAYQWYADGLPVPFGTNASLTLSNVQFSTPVQYWVLVSTTLGSATSTVARLSVSFPPAQLRIGNATAKAGLPVGVPVTIAANGNENAFSFSISFNRQVLRFESVTLGSGTTGSSLLVNTNLLNNGRVGVALSLPVAQTLGAGTQELAVVWFTPNLILSQTSTPIGFADSPLTREVADPMGETLAATYVSGQLLITAAEFEGDVAPRPRVDKQLTISDWVLAGRYAAQLDYPTNSSEFERADCAPRDTSGDGYITITDWVQVGRFVAKLDPAVAANGPAAGANTLPASFPPQKTDNTSRILRMRDAVVLPNSTASVSVELQAVGNENAVGFSVAFDPASLTLTAVTPGTGLGNAAVYVNTNNLAAGRFAIVLAMPIGSSFAVGAHELLNLVFRAASNSSSTSSVFFADQPIRREFSDADTRVLPATYADATVLVNPLPALAVQIREDRLRLTWPSWAEGFTLQEAAGSPGPQTPWRNTGLVPLTLDGQRTVEVPVESTNKYYRLISP